MFRHLFRTVLFSKQLLSGGVSQRDLYSAHQTQGVVLLQQLDRSVLSDHRFRSLDFRSSAKYRRESDAGDYDAAGHDCVHVDDRREHAHHL